MGTLDTQQPRFYRISDAAHILCISRSSAYELANEWLDSKGVSGLPCIRLGRRIVVPRVVIDEWAMIGADRDESA